MIAEPIPSLDHVSSNIATLDRRMLELIYQDGERAFVRGGLRPGEQLVAEGLHRLVPEQRVRLLGSEK